MADGQAAGALLPLPPHEVRDLPPLTLPFWKLTGPGAVLVGLSIGAGEIVVWPNHVAKYGCGIVWAAVLGVFLQLWINYEVGRWTIATGETVFTGFARLWRGFVPVFVLLTVAGWLAPGWARVSGTALKALLVGPQGFGSDSFWTGVTFALVALVLFGPKSVYNSVEKTISALVVLIVVGLLVVAFRIGTASDWGELARGMVNFGYKPEAMSIKDLFSAIVFAGAGGTANLFYTFYLRDKQIGMGGHVPKLLNPLRGRQETMPTTGYTFADTADNRRHFGQWFRYVVLDQSLYFWLLNTFTILLFIFGAQAALHRQGIVPKSGQLIYDQAAILGQMWGTFGTKLFLLVGVATLFSTQLALVDGVSRSLSDMIYTNLRAAQRHSLGWWYGIIACAWMVIGFWITVIMERRQVTDLGFLFNAGYMGGFAMAVYVPLQLYLNLRHLPAAARPKPLNIAMMAICVVVYCGFALFCVLTELGVIAG
ncbi:MAG: Nramp family divalent metal transporter [Fimbriimonadaceae bacterium]|nr:Nramp family divalent metal transporter [Fimbriimonadaceae bacterium]